MSGSHTRVFSAGTEPTVTAMSNMALVNGYFIGEPDLGITYDSIRVKDNGHETVATVVVPTHSDEGGQKQS